MEVLVVEDHPNDLRVAASAAQKAGFSQVEARSSIAAAREFLLRALSGTRPLPDAIVLDLDLGYESGFELLRFWHTTPELSKIPLVIWTILGNHYREICELFKVSDYVDKSAGEVALSQALQCLVRTAP